MLEVDGQATVGILAPDPILDVSTPLVTQGLEVMSLRNAQLLQRQ